MTWDVLKSSFSAFILLIYKWLYIKLGDVNMALPRLLISSLELVLVFAFRISDVEKFCEGWTYRVSCGWRETVKFGH